MSELRYACWMEFTVFPNESLMSMLNEWSCYQNGNSSTPGFSIFRLLEGPSLMINLVKNCSVRTFYLLWFRPCFTSKGINISNFPHVQWHLWGSEDFSHRSSSWHPRRIKSLLNIGRQACRGRIVFRELCRLQALQGDSRWNHDVYIIQMIS